MSIKRLVSQDRKIEISKVSAIRAKKEVDIDANDIKKLVIIMAKKMGLLSKE